MITHHEGAEAAHEHGVAEVTDVSDDVCAVPDGRRSTAMRRLRTPTRKGLTPL
jgi:hypothetical protein